ncbi:MAG: phospho-N-acetylmuramoyl-pentapeptide-transferase, partial [Terriglobales bacterium]
MLYWLLYERLFPYFRPLRLFHFITFRTAFAGITALVIALVLGPWLIRRLQQFQIRQYIREEGPRSHQAKAGTPTMGGLLINIAIIVPTLLWADLSNPFIWLAMFSVAAFGAIGFVDDFAKVRHRRNLGLRSRHKLGLQALVGLVIALALIWMAHAGRYSTRLVVPFFKHYRPELDIHSWLIHPGLYVLAFLPFILFVMLVVVGSSNAVNLTDG